ncbi:hypothetical protein LAV_00040 [Sphingobium phage Lacusarx]|uniref:Uncharacterized protein n=1 Tax=Sphingobium phage Lacusarx TaxID=1980139 RepID=A0A1W6DWP9_9CAUD|nr:hypothetical protein FDH44_gp040 [Sphingobium phage Lacusarx]ARK07440.1 hypothetical protein LAV_00040 [Sphingobium phage Lacusarx]
MRALIASLGCLGIIFQAVAALAIPCLIVAVCLRYLGWI